MHGQLAENIIKQLNGGKHQAFIHESRMVRNLKLVPFWSWDKRWFQGAIDRRFRPPTRSSHSWRSACCKGGEKNGSLGFFVTKGERTSAEFMWFREGVDKLVIQTAKTMLKTYYIGFRMLIRYSIYLSTYYSSYCYNRLGSENTFSSFSRVFSEARRLPSPSVFGCGYGILSIYLSIKGIIIELLPSMGFTSFLRFCEFSSGDLQSPVSISFLILIRSYLTHSLTFELRYAVA